MLENAASFDPSRIGRTVRDLSTRAHRAIHQEDFRTLDALVVQIAAFAGQLDHYARLHRTPLTELRQWVLSLGLVVARQRQPLRESPIPRGPPDRHGF